MEIKFFKKENKFKRDKQSLNTRKHWNIIIRVLAVLILGSFVFGYYIFTQEGQDFSVDTASVASTHHKINKDKLQKILDLFSEREKKSLDILNNTTVIVDPSK